jgi:hypothetical protein
MMLACAIIAAQSDIADSQVACASTRLAAVALLER